MWDRQSLLVLPRHQCAGLEMSINLYIYVRCGVDFISAFDFRKDQLSRNSPASTSIYAFRTNRPDWTSFEGRFFPLWVLFNQSNSYRKSTPSRSRETETLVEKTPSVLADLIATKLRLSSLLRSHFFDSHLSPVLPMPSSTPQSQVFVFNNLLPIGHSFIIPICPYVFFQCRPLGLEIRRFSQNSNPTRVPRDNPFTFKDMKNFPSRPHPLSSFNNHSPCLFRPSRATPKTFHFFS